MSAAATGIATADSAVRARVRQTLVSVTSQLMTAIAVGVVQGADAKDLLAARELVLGVVRRMGAGAAS